MLEGKSAHLNEHYKRRENAIQKCHAAAAEKGYTVFAVQDGGQCFSSADAKNKYQKYGSSSACSSDGKGGPMANHVYEISKLSLTIKPIMVSTIIIIAIISHVIQ